MSPVPHRISLGKTVNIDITSKEFYDDGLRVWCSGEPGAGKALALSTPIPTPTGWTTMGQLAIGDQVLDDKGQPCLVIDATKVMRDHECFEVEFDSGAKVIADAGHKWRTYSVAERLKHWRMPEAPFEGSVVETRDIARSVNAGNGKTNHAIPVVDTGIVCPEVVLPIPPYVLGVWLGDGTSATGVVTKPDMEIFDRMATLGFPSHARPSTPLGRRVEGLHAALNANGLLNNKHIPATYLRASRAQRLELLKGLMDTDGSADGAVEFSNTNFNLAQGVVELARSLGHKVALKESVAKLNGMAIGPYWRASWTPPEVVFSLSRKAALQKISTRPVTRWHYIVKCTPVPSVPVRCISVSSLSKLFLASEHMIPTHNSNTNMLFLSQWVEAGRQLIALDAHGEYGELWSLRPGSIVRIGYDDDPVKEESVEWVMNFVREGKSVLIDLKHWADVDPRPMDKFVRALMVELYRFSRAKPAQRLVLLEEAQNFVPQQQSKDQYDNVKSFIAMLTGGRKFGLHFILSSQRTGLVDVNAIAQCNVRIFHRTSELADWQRIQKYLPKKFPADFGSKTKRDISKLNAGEAIVVSRWFDTMRLQLPMPKVKVTKFLDEDAA